SAPPLPSGSRLSIELSPKLFVPSVTARLLSCNAPTTSSASRAVPPLISTTIGSPFAMSPGVALMRFVAAGLRPLTTTISPLSISASAVATAASKLPPGLLRKSRINPINLFPVRCFKSCTVPASAAWVVPSNPATRRYPMLPPSTRPATVCNLNGSRFIFRSIGPPLPRRNVSATSLSAEGQIVSRLLVDRKDQVSGINAGLRCRRPVLRRDHLQLSVLDRHHHSDAGHVVVRGVLHRPEGGLVEKGRARIEPGQHSGDRRIDQLCVGNRIDRILTDPFERLVEEVEFFVHAVLTRLLLGKNAARYE